MVPAGHVARIGWVERTGAGEPAQYTSAHRLLHRGEVLGCQRGGLGEVDLPVLAHREHPVDHAAVKTKFQCRLTSALSTLSEAAGTKMDMGIQRAAKALYEAHRPQPPARATAAFAQPRFDDA